jgi:CheY-like chemotaxis protein
VIEIRCPACEADLSEQPLGEARCPICGSELHILIDLREPATAGISPSILVVDHDPEIRRVLVTALEENGFLVNEEISNGPDAVLMSQRLHPAYVFLDQFMRAISGAETARLIREVSPNSVIISLSGDIGGEPEWSDAHLVKDELSRAPELLRSLAARPKR